MLTILLCTLACVAFPQPAEPSAGFLDTEAFSIRQFESTRDALGAARGPSLDEAEEAALTRAIDSAAKAMVNLRVSDGFPMQLSWNHAELVAELKLIAIGDPLPQVIAMDAFSIARFSVGDKRPDLMGHLGVLKARGLPPHLLSQFAAVGFANKAESEAAISFAVREAANAIRQPYSERADKRIVYAAIQPMLGDFEESSVDELRRLLAEYPPSDPWMMHTLLGVWHTELAWRRRGSQRADQTTDAQFAAFDEQLAIAREHLTKAYALDPGCPEPAAEMIAISMATGAAGEDSIEAWFRRAYEAQPDYAPAFDQMRTALRPRWGGSVERIRRFALWCVEPGRHPKGVGHQGWITFMTLRSEIGQAVWQDRELVEAVRRSIEELRGSNLSSVSPWYCNTVLMEIALSTGRIEDAAGHLRDLGGGLGRWQLRMRDRPHRPFGPELLPFHSAAKQEAMLAQRAEDADDWTAAADLWASALAKVDLNEDTLAHRAISDRLLRADRSASLRAGEWVGLEYNLEGIGSRLIAGEFRLLDDGTVSMHPESQEFMGPAVALFDIDPGRSYEIECDVWAGEGGLILGWSERRARHDAYTTVLRSDSRLTIGHSESKPIQVPLPEGFDNEVSRLRVRVEGAGLTVWLGEVQVYAGPAPSEQIANGERIGIGRQSLLPFGHRFAREHNRISNVRLRLIGADTTNNP